MPRFFIEVEATYQAEVEAGDIADAWFKLPYVAQKNLVRTHSSIIERREPVSPAVTREDVINQSEDKAPNNNLPL